MPIESALRQIELTARDIGLLRRAIAAATQRGQGKPSAEEAVDLAEIDRELADAREPTPILLRGPREALTAIEIFAHHDTPVYLHPQDDLPYRMDATCNAEKLDRVVQIIKFVQHAQPLVDLLHSYADAIDAEIRKPDPDIASARDAIDALIGHLQAARENL